MGKSSGSTSSTTTYQLSPEQQQIMKGAMGQFMPNGQLPSSAPTFNYNDNPELQGQGQNFVAPFSTPTQQAFAATEANYGAQQPTMDASKGATVAGGQHAGQFQGAPDGWTTNPSTGQAQYQDYATGIQKYTNPYTNDVINTGLGFLDTARQRADLTTNNDSVAKGSFGGTRQAVRNSLNDTSYAAQAQNLITGNLNTGYQNAQGQYNTGFGQGQQALGYNTGVAQGDRAAQLASGKQLGDQAAQNQAITGNDINALGAVGSQIQGEDQAQRDAARAAQMQNNTYGLSVASSLEGLGPPPSSTTNSKQSVSGSSIWGTLGSSALTGAGALLSDERAKTNVETADPNDSLAEIRKLKPKRYEYTDLAQAHGAPAGSRLGFMAQDLEKATGKAAPKVGPGFKGVDIAEHIGRLTAAVNALDHKVTRYSGKRQAA